MTAYPWTAAEINNLTHDWPKEARPDDLRYVPARPGQPDVCAKWCNHDGRLPNTHAAALHVASGIEWICRDPASGLAVVKGTGGRWYVGSSEGQTILHAISDAIREVSR